MSKLTGTLVDHYGNGMVVSRDIFYLNFSQQMTHNDHIVWMTGTR